VAGIGIDQANQSGIQRWEVALQLVLRFRWMDRRRLSPLVTETGGAHGFRPGQEERTSRFPALLSGYGNSGMSVDSLVRVGRGVRLLNQ
jgi:hypothetical protein